MALFKHVFHSLNAVFVIDLKEIITLHSMIYLPYLCQKRHIKNLLRRYNKNGRFSVFADLQLHVGYRVNVFVFLIRAFWFV